MNWKDVTKLQKRELIIKAVEELYDNIEADGISTITLNLNFNPYNFGHKLEIDYQIGYPKEDETTNEPISKRVYDISR